MDAICRRYSIAFARKGRRGWGLDDRLNHCSLEMSGREQYQ